jgi:hypothetical protein
MSLATLKLFCHSAVLLILGILATPSLNSPGSAGIPEPEPSGSEAHLFDSVRTDPGDYIWPTDAGAKVTSSFAEYRSTHFHAGIDIGTNGRTGWKVFAVRDGYVSRISIEANGYGKMLFVTHRDGYVSTYAHLLTFNDAINAVALAEQVRAGKYPIDVRPDSTLLPVRKGDVIAFTGESGFGPPHLHFEVRDEHLNPVNPMLMTAYAMKDNIRPSIRRLMLSPLTVESTVDNSPSPKYYSRFPRGRSTYMIPQTIRIHGKAGFAVESTDKSDGSWSKAGIHRMELHIDDSLAFSIQLDRIPWGETKQIMMHYDLPTALSGRGRFQKLYLEEGNSLPLYDNRPAGSGIIDGSSLSEGRHTYRIMCSDITGNRSELTGSLFVNHSPEISIASVTDRSITLTGKATTSLSKVSIYGKRLQNQGWTQHTLPEARFESANGDLLLPVNTGSYDILKIVAQTSSGSEGDPLFYFREKPRNTGQQVFVTMEPLRHSIRVAVTTNGMFTEKPGLLMRDGTETEYFPLRAVDVYKYVGEIAPSVRIGTSPRLEVHAEVNGVAKDVIEEIPFWIVQPSRPTSTTVGNGELTLSSDSGGVFSPLIVEVKTERSGRTAIFSLEPSDVLLNGGITCTLESPTDRPEANLGLYFRSNRGWVFQTNTPDSGRNTYSTTLTRTLGEIAIMSDDTPPTIGRLRIAPRGGRVAVGFRYYDNLSGVNLDELTLVIDGNQVIPEIDGEHHRVWYQAIAPLPRGKHTLRVGMRDRQGNAMGYERKFTVR